MKTVGSYPQYTRFGRYLRGLLTQLPHFGAGENEEALSYKDSHS